jgi:Mce-associated membrane protein
VLVACTVLALAAGCTSRTGNGPVEPTRSSETASAAEERDEMVDAGAEIAETLATVDPADVQGSVDAWLAVATGDLLTEYEDKMDTAVAQLTEAGSSAAGEALTAAATDFDRANGTATVLVALKTTNSQNGGDATDAYQRMRLSLTMTDDGWKADAIESVPVGG